MSDPEYPIDPVCESPYGFLVVCRIIQAFETKRRSLYLETEAEVERVSAPQIGLHISDPLVGRQSGVIPTSSCGLLPLDPLPED